MKVQYNYLFDYAAGMARHKRNFYLYMIVTLINAIQIRCEDFLTDSFLVEINHSPIKCRAIS
jgi:hypothetical protein